MSRPRPVSYAGPSVRVARREKQPHNGFIFGRPEALSPGIPRDTFGIPAATLAGVACPPNSDAVGSAGLGVEGGFKWSESKPV